MSESGTQRGRNHPQTDASIEDKLAEFEETLDECKEDLEAIADWDGRLGAMARVLIALAEDEEPATADLIDAGLEKYAMERTEEDS